MDKVIETIKRSNQRGGRMLSIIDLIEAETLTPQLSAWLVEKIEKGASFLVGANPGGAGKTAVMGALLTMLPDGERIHTTNRGGKWRSARPGDCVVSYEISPAHYEAYIWGKDTQYLAQLGLNGSRIAANLHADTFEEAREQLIHDNGVSERQADAFGLFIPIRIERDSGRVARFVEEVFWKGPAEGGADGGGENYGGKGSGKKGRADTKTGRVGAYPELSERGRDILSFLQLSRKNGIRRIEELRKEWFLFRSGS